MMNLPSSFRVRRFLRPLVFAFVGAISLSIVSFASGQSLILEHGTIHTVSNGTITNGSVVIQDGRVRAVLPEGETPDASPNTRRVDLNGGHLYPGLIALGSSLGLTEIESIRSTRDSVEVGEYTPDVRSWIAVNPDSELIPVARANGIAFFEPMPRGSAVAGQSALMTASGWTYEQMIVKAPAALHVFWPSMELNTAPRERFPESARPKPLDEQAKERRARLRALDEFFADARAYAAARSAGDASTTVPAWEAMRPYVEGRLPVFIHADEIRQIRAAIDWAVTNRLRAVLAGGRDAWMAPELLARHSIPVLYEHLFVQPVRDTDSYDRHFRAPEILHAAGVKLAFGFGAGGFSTTSLRNLPYAAAHAVAFGLPEEEALKALTLHPAECLGLADRLGSIEADREATLFVCDGDLLDVRSNVQHLWIRGEEVPLDSRHTRLRDKYLQRP